MRINPEIKEHLEELYTSCGLMLPDAVNAFSAVDLAFYRIEKGWISVTRILDGRTDYLRILFGKGFDTMNIEDT